MSNVPTPEDIAAASMKPRAVTSDGVSVTMASTQEQIDAAQNVNANKAARKGKRGIAFSRFIPGSAVGGSDRRE